MSLYAKIGCWSNGKIKICLIIRACAYIRTKSTLNHFPHIRACPYMWVNTVPHIIQNFTKESKLNLQYCRSICLKLGKGEHKCEEKYDCNISATCQKYY